VSPDKELFDWLRATSPGSATVIAPLLVDLVHPQSVLDVGCGDGAWIGAFATLGVSDALGVDTADPAAVALPPDRYRRVDLNQGFDPGRRFDLVVCLEVGEHLRPDAARALVGTLVRSAPVVAFSAAIPGQGGIGHVNEQWPDWWRARFADHGYRQHDVLRRVLWTNDDVAFWYAQNLFLYAEPDWEPPAGTVVPGGALPERLVHPALLARARAVPSVRAQLRQLPRSIGVAVRRRVGRAPQPD
jgi:SAM-dependent methyltransferase